MTNAIISGILANGPDMIWPLSPLPSSSVGLRAIFPGNRVPTGAELQALTRKHLQSVGAQTVRKILRDLLVNAAGRGISTVTVFESYFTDVVPDLSKSVVTQRRVNATFRCSHASAMSNAVSAHLIGVSVGPTRCMTHLRLCPYCAGELHRRSPKTTPKPQKPPTYMSIREAAKLLGCSTTTVRNRMKEGLLPGAVKVPQGGDPNRSIWQLPHHEIAELLGEREAQCD